MVIIMDIKTVLDTREKIEANKTILLKTREKMKKDNTIICYYKDDMLIDCNGYVCSESIALRELMLYGDFDEDFKNKIFNLLIIYGKTFDNDYDDFYEALKIVSDVICYEIDWIAISTFCIDKSYILEIAIREILLEYWQDYEIPTERYNEIIYSHNQKYSTYEKLMHHYKCLHNKNLDWNKYEIENKYQIELTYKDLKIISLNARDSGGHMDCFGYAHDITTMNCIHAFISDKYNLQMDDYYTFEDEELENVCQEVFQFLLLEEFYITLY